jgi:hypothetical protein
MDLSDDAYFCSNKLLLKGNTFRQSRIHFRIVLMVVQFAPDKSNGGPIRTGHTASWIMMSDAEQKVVNSC